MESMHIYRKSLNRLLEVCYVSTTSVVLIAFFSSFLVLAINCTNEANKAQLVHVVKQSIYLDVYESIISVIFVQEQERYNFFVTLENSEL
jgi:hypothetical protein